MARKRRNHTAEFKAVAVALVKEQGLSRDQVCRDLDIRSSLLSRWLAEAKAKAKAKAGVPAEVLSQQAAEQEELKRLRKEVEVLRRERDILKKAAAFFAKESL